ncbi:MAG: FecR domain-containing protein [Steroidobacteraceae bacterium]
MSVGGNDIERRNSDRTAGQAGYWDARLRAPDCTDAERALFVQWRDASSEHREAFEQLQMIVASFRHSMTRADIRALRDAALRAQKPAWWQEENSGRTRNRLFTAAAAVATLAIAAAIWTTLRDGAWRAPVLDLAAITDTLLGRGRAGIYETGIGQRSTVTLQDGSSVELNAKTRIKVAFTANTRNVELIDGQALFQIARNPQRPFVVRAADRDITAVGTAFDVRVDETSLRVTLLEGKVKVSRDSSENYSSETHRPQPFATDVERGARGRERESAAPSIPAENSGKKTNSSALSALQASTGVATGTNGEDAASSNEIFLAPGQQLVALRHVRGHAQGLPVPAGGAPRSATDYDLVVRSIDTAKIIGWRDGRVFLEDLSLADAVAEMNRHSVVQIRLDDPQLARLRVNGMFLAGEQEAFITALEQYFPITVKRRQDTQIDTDITLTRRR